MAYADEITMSVGGALKMSTTYNGTFTAIAGVRSVDWKGKRGSSDASALADAVMVKKGKGRRDPGTLTGTIIYSKTQFSALFTLHTAGTFNWFQVVGADGSILGPLYGHFSSLGLKLPEDDPLENDFEIDCGASAHQETFTPSS